MLTRSISFQSLISNYFLVGIFFFLCCIAAIYWILHNKHSGALGGN